MENFSAKIFMISLPLQNISTFFATPPNYIKQLPNLYVILEPHPCFSDPKFKNIEFLFI